MQKLSKYPVGRIREIHVHVYFLIPTCTFHIYKYVLSYFKQKLK